MIFERLEFPVVTFYGDNRGGPISFILAIIASHLLCKGCVGYLAYVVDTRFNKIILEDIRVVKDFLDVFSEDLLGLPLGREIDFGIDLVSGTNSISVPSLK